MESILHTPAFGWIGLPLLIFLARMLDVALGTTRIIFISRGYRHVAPFIGFFEIMIWFFSMSQVMHNLQNPVNLIAYAGGFAYGNFLGMFIEEKLAVGKLIIRAITSANNVELVAALRRAGFGVTTVEAAGMEGPMMLLYSIVRRRELPDALAIIREVAPEAVYTVEDVRIASDYFYPATREQRAKSKLRLLNFARKDQ